jgi:hypothetical protein
VSINVDPAVLVRQRARTTAAEQRGMLVDAELAKTAYDVLTQNVHRTKTAKRQDEAVDLVITLPSDSLDWTPGRIDPNAPRLRTLRYQIHTGADAGSRFTSTEKVVLTAEELTIGTVADFRALLALVLKRAGLTCGQIAAKTSIGRSSVYNLVDVRREGLPTKGDQVQEFLCACGLQLRQVATVMRSWELLDAQRAKPTGKPAATTPPAATPIAQLSPREILQEAVGARGPRVRDFAVRDIARELVRLRTLLPILFSIGVLLGCRWYTYDTGPDWKLLVPGELLFIPLLLRWRLRRTAAPRLSIKKRAFERVRRPLED